jgi:uncharacterized RDD family membrane protein YckC
LADLPTEAYTPWVTRFIAYLIDAAPAIGLVVIGWILLMATRGEACETIDYGYGYGSTEVCATGTTGLGWMLLWLCYLAAFAYAIWNWGYKQGTTGSSIGKGMQKFKVVSEKTGQPIGFGMSVVRQLAHGIDGAICGIGYLFPLWDKKRQTIADKLLTTVCVPT